MRLILLLTILLSFSNNSLSQCIDGDCVEGYGIIVSNNINTKYVGEFNNGEFHGNGKLYKIVYKELQSNLYSKNEVLVFDGVYENGNQKYGKFYVDGQIQFEGIFKNGNFSKGKSYDNGVIVYDGEYSVKGDYLIRDGYGKSYKNQKITFDGIFEDGSFKKGKSYDDNEILIYDGEFEVIGDYLMRHGYGVLYIDNKKYYLNFHEGDYEYYVNKYHSEDIKGNLEKTDIKLKTRDGGLNELIDIEINGIQFSYTYDTGAEVFDISPGLEKILIENGLIDNKDYYPPINSVDANGNITLTRRVKISGIKIGDYIVDNVVVTINQKDDDPLLFGRAILNKKFNNNVRWRPGLLTLYK